MSDPPTAASEPQPHHRQHIHGIAPATTSSKILSSAPMAGREYHKGNWTVQETMILIAAKKLNDEQRNKSASAHLHDPEARKGQLRWKWVENYCWNNGCRRSQNQCNDKWDNLLRDYKKIRDYESKASSAPPAAVFSYWTMEKHYRKENNLPSNMPFEVFQALNDVVQKKLHQTLGGQGGSSSNVVPYSSLPVAEPLLLPPSDTRTDRASPAALEGYASSSGTDSNEKHSTDPKRRKVEDVGSSILQSASLLAQTLQACSEKKEKRHKEMMAIERRRLQIEESRNEVNRQGITDLVAAVANLSQAIQTLVSDHHDRES